MQKQLIAISLLFILFFSCTQQEKPPINTFAPKVVVAKCYVVPKDKIAEPATIPFTTSLILKTGPPDIVSTNTNIRVAGKPKINIAGTPQIITPGTKGVPLPEAVKAIDSVFAVGIPEVVIAKDPISKDYNPYNFSSLNILQGLKNDIIHCMLQDKSGNLWFGTFGGVTRYDGKSFTHFTEKEGLSNNMIWSIFEDKVGNLWFGTNMGLTKYDGKFFTHFTSKGGACNNTVWSILEDKKGFLWFTTSVGVSKYDGNIVESIEKGEKVPSQIQKDLKKTDGKFVKSFTNFTIKNGLGFNSTLSSLQDVNGNIWFGHERNGVSKYDGKSFTHFSEKEGLTNKHIWSIVEDKIGNIWFGIDEGGITKFNGNRIDAIENEKNNAALAQQDLKRVNGKLIKSFTNYSQEMGLISNSVLSIMVDELGNLWVGTFDGVSKFDGSRIDAKENGEIISNEELQDLKKTDKKFIKSFTNYTEREGLSSNRIYAGFQDRNENIWFCTRGGGVCKYTGTLFTHFTEKDGLNNNIVSSISKDKNGNLWFGSLAGGVSKFDGQSFSHFTKQGGLNENGVMCMFEDKEGDFWFGTSSGRIIKYDGKTFKHFILKGFNNNVIKILEDNNGNLWFVLYANGVVKYDGNRVEAIERGDKISSEALKDLKKANGKFVKSCTRFTIGEGLINNTVFSILQDTRGNIWFGTKAGVTKYDPSVSLSDTGTAPFIQFTTKEGLSDNVIRSILEDKTGNIWFGTDGGISKYDGNRVEAIEKGEKVSQKSQQGLKKINGRLIKSFTHFTENEGLSNNCVKSILEDKTGNLWFGTLNGINCLTKNALSNLAEINYILKGKTPILFKSFSYSEGFLGVNVISNMVQDKNGNIWVGTGDRLTSYNSKSDNRDTVPPNIQITGIGLFNENIAWSTIYSPTSDGIGTSEKKETALILGNGVKIENFHFDGLTKWYSLPENLSLAYNNNSINFNFIGITQKQSKKVKYQYKLEGLDDNWSALTSRSEAPYGNLPHGTYTFKVKAMNSEGYWSNEYNYSFTIRPPWWLTWWFKSFASLFIITSVVGFFQLRTSALRKRQKELADEVRKKTAEVVHQKEEIEEKQKEIVDSITYAKRIQDAILPPDHLIKEWLPDSFILYKPKDIVAGDFYWIECIPAKNTNWISINNTTTAKADTIIFAAADFTGHGVPGAMVSVVCNNALNRALREFGLNEPAQLLNKTRELVIEQFEKSKDEVKDGMDISLCALEYSSPHEEEQGARLQWAGANNPLWIIKNGELIEYKANKQPIGKYPESKPFNNHSIKLQKGDRIYIFTDGYADQFGGDKSKKFKASALKQLLLDIQLKTMAEQKEILDHSFEKWKGNLEQIDDVCIIGVNINF